MVNCSTSLIPRRSISWSPELTDMLNALIYAWVSTARRPMPSFGWHSKVRETTGDKPPTTRTHHPLNHSDQRIKRLTVLRSFAISGVWDTLLVGRPRHEDGGGFCRPPLHAHCICAKSSGSFALLGLFCFSAKETLALCGFVSRQFDWFLFVGWALGLV